MSIKSLFRPLFLLLSVSLIWAIPPANAAGVGTSAWSLINSSLSSGPGAAYPITSSSVFEGQSVRVTRCTRRWCKIANSSGWLSIDYLSFGQTATGPFSGPKFDTGRGGSGNVCFFNGANFSGASICLPSGAVARDLALWGWDNKISSVSVGDGVSVNLCRDRNFTSYCVLIDQDTAQLDRLLANAASSYQIW